MNTSAGSSFATSPTRRFALTLFLLAVAFGGTAAFATKITPNFLSGFGAVVVTGWVMRPWLARAQGLRWFLLPFVSIVLASLLCGLGDEIARVLRPRGHFDLERAGLHVALRTLAALMTSPWIGYPLALLAHYLLRWYGLPPNPVVPEPTGGANPAPAVLSGRRAFGLLFLALVPGVGFLLRRPPQRRSAAPVASTASAVPAAPRSPDPADVWKENVPGRFGVDRQCIDCDLCREIAPLHFSHNNQEGYSYVARQPATPEETARVLEALEGCPVEAIFDRGKLPAQTG